MSVVKRVDAEPIPGYRLLERLGQGGFGEVWKCEAPGGLYKAIKFVGGTDNPLGDPAGAEQELQALQRVKAIRHPFLLSIERVELIDGELVLVTELADRSLRDLLVEYRAAGRQGVPRAELLGYLREAAEVLDLMNQEHGLQHLDVKPRNLFLVGRHVKVADFGLVNSLAELHGSTLFSVNLGAVTPLYAAPETFLGRISTTSDQYSLAVTYYELLTGAPPFSGRNFRQLAQAHQHDAADLSRLPEGDRRATARALCKEPRQRFPSCTAFLNALEGQAPLLKPRAELAGPATIVDLEAAKKSEGVATTCVVPSDALDRIALHLKGGGDDPSAAPDFAQEHLAGYRFRKCQPLLPNVEVWKAVDPTGNRRQVVAVSGYAADPAALDALLSRLKRLRHPMLAPSEVFAHNGRLVIVSDPPKWTLADELRECQRLGRPGLPRGELLEYLADAAAALDELYAVHQVRHLSLSPRHLCFGADGPLRVADFGLGELVWLPAGHPPAVLGARYVAPELFEAIPTPTSDQYSLAVVYQELLTGTHPFHHLTPRQMTSPRQRGKPDLGMLPGADRPAVLRALDTDPARRFPNGAAFVETLAKAGTSSREVRCLPKADLPPPASAVLPDGPPRPRVNLVPHNEALRELVRVASGGIVVQDLGGLRCVVRPGPSLEHHCVARVAPADVERKLEGFRYRWGAERTAHAGDRFVYRIPLPGSLMQRLFGRGPALEAEVRLRPGAKTSLTPLTTTLRAVGAPADRANEVLERLGGDLLESLRCFLAAVSERRRQERWPFEQDAQVRPLANGAPAGPVVAARTRDVSLSGMGLYVPGPFSASDVLIRLEPPQGGGPLELRAQVVHLAPCPDGRVEVGVRFPAPSRRIGVGSAPRAQSDTPRAAGA
jgi:serine/threonine protein kinase